MNQPDRVRAPGSPPRTRAGTARGVREAHAAANARLEREALASLTKRSAGIAAGDPMIKGRGKRKGYAKKRVATSATGLRSGSSPRYQLRRQD